MSISSQPSKETKPESLTSEELKAKRQLVEAALYVAGYPVELGTLCSITKIFSKKKIYDMARIVADEYRQRDGALEVVELEDQRFVMQLKSAFVHKVRRLSIKPLLTEGPMKTLSYIAYKQPISQAKVILVRGPQAYEHIGKLLEMGLLTRERLGRTHMLRTSERFADYFSLSKDSRLMRKQIEAMFTNAKFDEKLIK